MDMDIFEFYNFVNDNDYIIEFISFNLNDDDGGTTYDCYSNSDVLKILLDTEHEIMPHRLYELQYSVNILELRVRPRRNIGE